MDIHFDKEPSRLSRLIKKKKLATQIPSLISGMDKKFICVPIQQTGIKKIENLIDYSPITYSLTVRNIIDRIGKQKWEETFSFTFVRNPWEKVVAHYLHQCKYRQAIRQYPMTFENWVMSTYVPDWQYFMHNDPISFLPQLERIKNVNGEITVKFIGRFESFESDLQVILKELGLNPQKTIKIKNKELAYRLFYNQKTKKVVADWFSEDIDFFKYKYKY